MSNRCKIFVLDKNDKYSFLFKGFRKNKFEIQHFNTLSKCSANELADFDLFFMVLYETVDVFELLKIFKGNTPIIIASNNIRIINKMKNSGCYYLVDLSHKKNLNIEFLECMQQVVI